MNTRHAARLFWPELLAICLTLLCFANNAAGQAQGGTSNVKAGGGLMIVTFTFNPGTITVNLPDDIMAGDTISGTVVAEPKGSTSPEKEKNKTVLEGMVIDLPGTKVPVNQRNFIWVPPTPLPGQGPPGFQLRVIELRDTPPSRTYVYTDCFITTYGWPKLAAPASANIVEKVEIRIPSLGQAGRPIVITGPFDGNSDNTRLQVAGESATPLAESPRKVVFESPANVTGPIEITVKEGASETKGTYRNVAVNLTAPKTSLLKGEKTILTVEVTGLQGLTQPVPLTLESHGVITMQGGMYQPLVIQPSQVRADGRYSTTRGITGVQPGGWDAKATVVTYPFNFCLQDDNGAGELMLNSVTGAYLFTPHSSVAGPYSERIETLFSGPSAVGKITLTESTIHLEQNDSTRRVVVDIDRLANNGTATIESRPTKRKFTITDRNTRDNTCACGPGCR
jgi:hypothetical protein